MQRLLSSTDKESEKYGSHSQDVHREDEQAEIEMTGNK